MSEELILVMVLLSRLLPAYEQKVRSDGPHARERRVRFGDEKVLRTTKGSAFKTGF